MCIYMACMKTMCEYTLLHQVMTMTTPKYVIHGVSIKTAFIGFEKQPEGI